MAAANAAVRPRNAGASGAKPVSRGRGPGWDNPAGPGEEAADRRGVEVEHLRAGELPLTHAVKAENLTVEAVPSRRQAALPPQHDHLLAGRRNHPRLEPPEIGGGLQPVPVRGPALAAPAQSPDAAAIGKGRRPAELDIGLAYAC